MKTHLFNVLMRACLAVVFLTNTNIESFGQSVTKTTLSPVSGTVCPVSITEYSVSIPSGFQTCSRLWTVTNGQIDGSATGTTVKVKWNDTPGATGTVTATFSACGNSNDGKTSSKSELILSINDQSFGTYTNTVNIDYCTPSNVILQVPKMFVQGTGGINHFHKLRKSMHGPFFRLLAAVYRISGNPDLNSRLKLFYSHEMSTSPPWLK